MAAENQIFRKEEADVDDLWLPERDNRARRRGCSEARQEA